MTIKLKGNVEEVFLKEKENLLGELNSISKGKGFQIGFRKFLNSNVLTIEGKREGNNYSRLGFDAEVGRFVLHPTATMFKYDMYLQYEEEITGMISLIKDLNEVMERVIK